jgi:short-subunit dehydrogenase
VDSLNGTRLKNKIVLITGASSGIGMATARAFAGAGATLLLVARNAERLLEVEALLRKSGARAHSFPLDISDPKAVQSTAAAIVEAFGTPDVLINNAGSGTWKFIHETAFEEVHQFMAVPFYGAFYMTKAFLDGMLKRGSGHIVNMTSYAGMIPFSGATSYVVARKAMIGFHEALTADLHRTGITTSLAYFAKVESSYWENNPGSEERVPGSAALVPAITPEKAARAILRGVNRGRRTIYTPRILYLFNLLHRWTPWFTRWLMHETDYPIHKTYEEEQKT